MYPSFEAIFQNVPLYNRTTFEAAKIILIQVATLCTTSSDKSLIPVENQIIDPRIREATHFISENRYKAIHVEDVARHCCLSNSRFLHLFGKEVGVSFTKFIIGMKIEEAKEMLVGSAIEISKIANELGYKSADYFSAAFKKKTGMSPLAFRRTQRLKMEP